MKGLINCRFCNSTLIAKKGNIKVHHFSHCNNSNCDVWYHSDEKSHWHVMWQNICKKKYIENIIDVNNVKHIADIYNKNKTIIEIQKSYINKNDIVDREIFYKNMIWIINLKDLNSCVHFSGNNFIILKTTKRFFTFMQKPLFFDTRYGLLKRLCEFDNGYNICEFVSMAAFLNKYFCGILKKSVNKTLDILTKDNENIEDSYYDINCHITNTRLFFSGKDCEKLNSYFYLDGKSKKWCFKEGYVNNA